MNQTNKVYLKTTPELLQSLLADEAKQSNMISNLEQTVSQLKAKNSFRIALIHQLQNNLNNNKTNEDNK